MTVFAPLIRLLAAVDWPTIVAFILAEVAVVLGLAPRFIQARNEARAVAVFRGHLLPILTAELRAVIDAALAALQPSPEAQAQAQADLATAIGEAVSAAVPGAAEAAISEAVKGRMGALSAAGVEARQSNAAMEWAFKQAVGAKGGLTAVLALNLMPKAMLKAGSEAFALAPESFDAWWDENGQGLLGGAKSKPKVPYIGGGG